MTPARPIPQPDEVTQPYWDAAKRGELVMQRCGSCQRWIFQPKLACPSCHSDELVWEPVSGIGTIYSFVKVHPPVLPAFKEKTPYLVVLVELAEDPGLRVLGNLLDHDTSAARIGHPVAVVYESLDDGVVLPQWQLTD